MPTPNEVRARRELRARFINAVYDARERQSAGVEAIVMVHDVLRDIDADQLDQHTITRLVKDLEDDFLIEGFGQSWGEAYPEEIRLTPAGRMEVETWLAEDAPTPHLPIVPSQVINNTTNVYGNATGSAFVTGSTDTAINMQTAVSEPLSQLLPKLRELLNEWDGTADEREDIEADIEMLEGEAVSQTPRLGRIKAAARRVIAWATSAAAAGASTVLTGEVQELANQVVHQL